MNSVRLAPCCCYSAQGWVFLDLTWPPMLTSKNTTGLTGLEFATAMAATRKQKSRAPSSDEPKPSSEGLVSRAGAGRADRGRGPPPEAVLCAPRWGLLVSALALRDAAVTRTFIGPDHEMSAGC